MDELKNHTLGGFPMMKLKSLSLMTGTTAIVLLLGVPSWAAEQPGLGIANNDSIYIDGNSFKIVPGKGKGDSSALIKKFDAHPMGPGMIIFRSGDKLYIADVSPSVVQTGYASDRYGSDRDESVSAAQAERDWQEWQRSLRQNSRYGSDRDESVSAAQAERDWQEWQRSLRQNSRYGSDRDARSGYAFAPSATRPGAVAGSPRSGCNNVYNYDRALNGYSYDLVCNGINLSPRGSDRYGSDRDTSVSAAQAARDWQEFVRQNPRYGSDRDESVSAAQAERDWQEWQRSLRQNSRYGSDRDESVSAAQAERDWQEWQRSLRQNSRYGSDRDTSVSEAQAAREWQEFVRQNPRYGSDRYGSDRDTSVSVAQAAREWQEFVRQNPRYGSDRYGSDRDTSVSAAQAERDWQEYLRGKARYGSDRIVIDDPEYVDYKLKKIFADNWTASETK
jgi:hypothetical protein